MTKAGYVAIIGKPNAGKSTLLNSLLGAKLSIVTPKPQTTRKRVLGIYTEGNSQIVFLDTPGVLNPKYTMQRIMMDYVSQSISEADIIVILLDIEKYSQDGIPLQILDIARSTDKPLIAVLSKMDLLKDRKAVLPIIAELSNLNIFSDIIPISARRDVNIQELTLAIEKLLPRNEFYFDEDILSTQNERFFVSEIIRESIFLLTKDEIPYSTEVAVIEFKERENGKWFINAEIIVERDTQKRIIIGSEGSLIKEIGERARKKIEMHLDAEIYLELFVKVRKNWRDDSNRLRSLGY